MGRTVIVLLVLMAEIYCSKAQNTTNNTRPLTLEEYELAKAIRVGDMDHKSYLEIMDAYILDRYDMRKPYFITGNGPRKRFDLYKYKDKSNLQEIGILIFCTNEKSQLFVNCLPNSDAAVDVWQRFFNDIQQTDREETNYILALFYVLRKELGLNLFTMQNTVRNLIVESDIPQMTLMRVGEKNTLLIHYADMSLRRIDSDSNQSIVTVDGIRTLRSLVEGEELKIVNTDTREIESHIVICVRRPEIMNGAPFVRNDNLLER